MAEQGPRSLDALFRALANDTRREIIALLNERSCTIGEFAQRFGMSFAAVSKHLKVLEEVGLVDREVLAGRKHAFSLNGQALGPAYAMLSVYTDFEQEGRDMIDPTSSADKDVHHRT